MIDHNHGHGTVMLPCQASGPPEAAKAYIYDNELHVWPAAICPVLASHPTHASTSVNELGCADLCPTARSSIRPTPSTISVL